MNKNIFRNVALVTAVFMLALSTMLVVNYFQVRKATPLKTEVMETLKQLNESNGDNEALQAQIRQLDLLSRKAYFTQESHLKTGVYILCGMAAVLVLCLRYYFKESKKLPSKELDAIDEWMNKSKSRTYMTWGSVAAVAAALLFAFLSSPALRDTIEKAVEEGEELMAENSDATSGGDAVVAADSTEVAAADTTAVSGEDDGLPIPKVTSNAFRGNNASAVSGASGIPTSWDLGSGKNILWKKPIPKHGYNSPVINGRNVFITGADNAARELYCYDVYTGELKWTVKADNIPGSPSTMPKVNADTGLAGSTVATNGKQVCAIFATGDVIGVDMEGNRLWGKNIGLPDNHYGYASSLLMFGNELIIQYLNNSKSQILALNAANGNQLWSKTTKDKIAWSSPIIATLGGKSALVITSNPAVTAYNPSNGAELWRVDCLSGEVGASPTANNGVVYAASEYSKCIAIDGTTGEVKWEVSDYLPECASPAATKNLLFVATSYGMFCAYNTEDGSLVKEHDLSDAFYSSPVIVEGKVYLFSNSGKAYIFSASDCSLITSFNTGEKTFATPAFTDGMMVVRTDNSIYCVKKS